MDERIAVNFKKAEELYINESYEKAGEIYLDLTVNEPISTVCFFRLAEISAFLEDPQTAYNLYYIVLEKEPEHINYFSCESLFSLLKKFDFQPMECKDSNHYNG